MVWKAENTRDKVWEKRYQHWVKNNWTEEFFMNEKKPIYYKFSHSYSLMISLSETALCHNQAAVLVIFGYFVAGQIDDNHHHNAWYLPGHKMERREYDPETVAL